jgi:hypothetical protein
VTAPPPVPAVPAVAKVPRVPRVPEPPASAPAQPPWGAGLPPPGPRGGRRAWPVILLILLGLLLLNAIGHAIEQSRNRSGDGDGSGAPAGAPRVVAAGVAYGRTSTCSYPSSLPFSSSRT